MKRRAWKLVAWLAGIIVLLCAIVVLSPYWLGLILPTVLGRFHLSYARYEATDYSHFKLHDVTFASGGTRFKAGEVEGLTPLVWVWDKSRRPAATFLKASDWTLTFEKSDTVTTNAGFPQSVKKAQAQLNSVRSWLTRVELVNGKVEVAGQSIPVTNAILSSDTVSATGSVHNEPVVVQGQLGANFPWTLQAAAPGHEVRLEVVVTNSSALGGIISWRTNRANFSASYSDGGMLPQQALVTVPDFRLSTNDIDLRGYKDLSGSFSGSWERGKFNLDLRADAEPLPASTNLQPVTVTIVASGDTNSASITKLNISSPGLDAHLSGPVAFSLRGEMLSQYASFVVKADLNTQHFLPVRGSVSGMASLYRKPGTYPEVIFDVSGNRVSAFDIESAQMKTHGRFNWPLLELQKLNAKFDNGTVADINASVELDKRFVREGTISFSGKIGEDLLPLGYDYERLSLQASFSGSLNRLRHSGEISFGEVIVPRLKTFRAAVKWSGESMNLHDFKAQMRVTNAAAVEIGGAAEIAGGANDLHIKADIKNFSATSGAETFALKGPFQITAELNRTNKTVAWNAATTQIEIRSPSRDVTVEGTLNWPRAGRIAISGHRLDADVLNAFLIRPLPAVQFDKISSAIAWSNAPAKWNIDATARFASAAGDDFDLRPFSARVQMAGDAQGIVITNLTISQNAQLMAFASGIVPVTIEPHRLPSGMLSVIQTHDNERLRLQAKTLTNSPFWDALTRGTPLTVHNPSLWLAVEGTLREPSGTLRCEVPAAKVKLLTNYINIANLNANLTLDRRHIQLTNFSLLVEGQSLSARGTLPIPEHLTNWHGIFDWRKATLQVSAANVQIAPFADLERRFISPQGALWANIRIDKGQINGSIVVTNAATRPIAQFGAIRDIDARLNFSKNRIQIERSVGTLSGGPVALFGWADIAHIDRATRLPHFVINVRGDSVPVARRSDVIVRAKFDITAANTNAGSGIVTGAVELQQSYILADLKLLVPPRTAKPESRPPYFSVEAEPFAGWKLDVNVKGDHFLKVRSPFFNGECSANMHLGGTLGEPLALGDGTINSGEVQFPFANVKVNQGFVTLTAAHPYMPHLFITGSANAYEYDIRMTVTGPVSDPKLEFTSTPGLTSEQILVMLTTGELPATSSALTLQQRTLRVGAFVGKNILSRFGIGGGEQRLTVQSGRDLSQQNTETYSVEYKVNPDWSVIGDYNKFGGLNVGLKWRFFSE